MTVDDAVIPNPETIFAYMDDELAALEARLFVTTPRHASSLHDESVAGRDETSERDDDDDDRRRRRARRVVSRGVARV